MRETGRSFKSGSKAKRKPRNKKRKMLINPLW
jgi:hypothetical protein